MHAILLQMAAEKIYGPANSSKFDALTVGIPHGDAAAAMIGGNHEINNHFTAPPFQNVELKAGVRRVTTAEEILGGPASYMVAYATEKFRNDNPKVYGAFVAALRESHRLHQQESGAGRQGLSRSSPRIRSRSRRRSR